MRPPDEAARRASRLLRWYPAAWRSRYGEEFAELLIADISERPRSRTRTADVVRGGIVARLGTAACAVMVVFLGGCCAWILDPGPGPRNLFHPGAIDTAGAVVLTIAFAAARQAARVARLGTARA